MKDDTLESCDCWECVDHSIGDDDWSYDEMKDNELQDRLAAEEPNNNPVY